MSSQNPNKPLKGCDSFSSDNGGIYDVGKKLRRVRLRKGLTLKAVAERTGLSESFISQLERGRSNASIASIQRIAVALDTPLSELFEEIDDTSVKVLRKNERPSLAYGTLGRKSLLTPASLKHLEVFIGEFDVGGSTGAEPYSHGDSEELLYILSGTFEVQVGNEFYTLTEGDCINYRSSNVHRVENVGEEPGEVMWIISPPSM